MACVGADEASLSEERAEDVGIEVEYVAHASFLLRADDGTQLLIDPYASRVWLGYDAVGRCQYSCSSTASLASASACRTAAEATEPP